MQFDITAMRTAYETCGVGLRGIYTTRQSISICVIGVLFVLLLHSLSSWVYVRVCVSITEDAHYSPGFFLKYITVYRNSYITYLL